MRRPDPTIVAALRDVLDESCRGMARAMPLAEIAHVLLCHPRRVSEAASEFAATGYPVGSVAGIGLWRIEDEEERRRAIRPEAHRLVAIARRLDGLGWRYQARDLRQLALNLGATL